MTLPSPDEWPVEDPIADKSRDVLRERAESTPDATAIVDGATGESWTYAAFDRRVDEWSAGLADKFSLEGTRVGVALPTGIEFATAYFAIVRQNGVAVPLNVRAATETVARQAEQAGTAAILCHAATESMAQSVVPDGGVVLSIDEPRSSAVQRFRPTDPAAAVARTADRETDRLVLFTSGTTGDPKGVRLTRGNLLASAAGSAQRLGVVPADRWLVCLPMYHMGGLAPLVRSTLYGTTTVCQQGFDTERTATVIEDRAVTGVSLVPTMLQRLLDDGWEPPTLLRFVLLGGAPARPALIEQCESAGVPVYPTYGTTETASQITTATPAEAFETPETVGRPLAPTTVTVVEDGPVTEPGTVGELVVSGPTVTPGYLDAGQTDAAFSELGFHTGDVGYRDEDGRFFVVGRVDDQIVTGGENVQPAAVARTLEDQSCVAAAAVVGVPDEEWGQRVTAAVVPAEDGLSADEVIDRARNDLADFAVPKSVVLVDSLPRTASGTIDREAVRSLVAEDDS